MRFSLNRRMVFFKVPPYKRRFLTTLKLIGILFILAAISFYMIDIRIRPALRELLDVRTQQIATKVINEAVREDLLKSIQYDTLIKTKFNEAGKVTMLQPNTGEINRIYSLATLTVQKSLQNLEQEEIKVPLGQVMGSRILAGMGPEIPVKIHPIGIVESSLHDQFDSAGINQVRHRIYLTVKATVKTVVPWVGQQVSVSTDIPLTEAIIVGDVPGVYVGSGGIILPTK